MCIPKLQTSNKILVLELPPAILVLYSLQQIIIFPMKKLITSFVTLVSLFSLTQAAFAESIITPWDNLKVGDVTKGMKVSYVTTGAYPASVVLEGRKLVSGTVSCNDGDYGFICDMHFNKASQEKLPWAIEGAMLECLKAGQDACDMHFAEGKTYRVTTTIVQMRDTRCTECDGGGTVVRMGKLMMKREVK